MIARAVYGLAGADFDLPQYLELTNPGMNKNQPTADEIKNHILNRLMEG
jgi:hypothetical protein